MLTIDIAEVDKHTQVEKVHVNMKQIIIIMLAGVFAYQWPV